MDDIYFSRKKNNPEEPKTPIQPQQTPTDEPGKDVFSLDFGPVDRHIPGNNAHPTAPPQPLYAPQQPPQDVQSRIPRELRTGTYSAPKAVSDEQADFFEMKYQNPQPQYRSAPSQGTPASSPKRPPVKKGKKKKKKRGFKIFLSILIILLICLGCVGAYGFSVLNKLNYDTDGIEKNEYISQSELVSDSKVTNILFIGCDDANGATYSRSDTMMLVSIDRRNKAIKLTSFLRDTYIYIPAKDKKAKLNSACSAGGAQYVIDTLEYNFEVDIERYVLVDFDMFEDVVNALGGIDVEISQKEADFLNNYCSFTGTVEGVNHLAGWQALTYSRIRKLKNETDFNRTERQRKVISAIVAKAKTSSIFSLVSQLDAILANVQTDIPKSELISLGVGAVASYLRYDIMQLHIPAGEHGDMWYYDTANGESVIRIDVEKNTAALQDFVYKQSPKDEEKATEK